MNGKVHLNISKNLPPGERVKAYANDEFVFYLHKRGVMQK